KPAKPLQRLPKRRFRLPFIREIGAYVDRLARGKRGFARGFAERRFTPPKQSDSVAVSQKQPGRSLADTARCPSHDHTPALAGLSHVFGHSQSLLSDRRECKRMRWLAGSSPDELPDVFRLFAG